MRIVIDLQGAQTLDSRNRGIGRYSLSLSQAIVRNRGPHEIILALSGNFPDTIEPIRSAFEGLLPQENIRVWDVPAAVAQNNGENDLRRKAAEIIREAFLFDLHPDVLHITSLFEGFSDDAVVSIGNFSKHIPTTVTLYDLIPLIYRDTYLASPAIARWYDEKISYLRKADLCLSISESSRSEGVKYLGIPLERIVNVSTAAEAHFQPVDYGYANAQQLLSEYGIKRPFLLYTGGIDYRKNLERLIRAYAQLPAKLRQEHQLVIVCSIQPEERRRLTELAARQGLVIDELLLTGFVPEKDLVALYNLCKAFIFPSWHEGFGLPALEAMNCGAAVIGANTSSLPEVIGREDALFDPFNEAAITDKIIQVLTDSSFRKEIQSHGLLHARDFSWDECGIKAVKAFETLQGVLPPASESTSKQLGRLKLAYVSPLVPEQSGISYYSAELLPELAQYYDITVVVEQEQVDDPWIAANCSVQNSEWLRMNALSMDRVLYHFGNSSFHQHMFPLLSEVPGVVVLHDFFLSGAQAFRAFETKCPWIWLEELWLGHGYAAVESYFHEMDLQASIWKYPVNFSVLRMARGIIVHSEFSRKLAKTWYGSNVSQNWTVIPLLRTPRSVNNRIDVRNRLGFGADDFVVCCFGIQGPTKLSRLVVQAWCQSSMDRNPRCHLIFVGEAGRSEYCEEFLQDIQRAELPQQIKVTGWVDSETFDQYLCSADMAIQLRTLSRGETSAALLDCLKFGIPTIVNANGSNAELPPNAVWMLPDNFPLEELTRAMETIFLDTEKRSELQKEGRRTIKERHNPGICAAMYAQTIERYYASQCSVQDVVKDMITMGCCPENKTDCMEIADCIARNHPEVKTERQLLVDVSMLIRQTDMSPRSAAARNILAELLSNPPIGFRVEPVYFCEVTDAYYYAREFTLQFMGCKAAGLSDVPADIQFEDVLFIVDWRFEGLPKKLNHFARLRQFGVRIYSVLIDSITDSDFLTLRPESEIKEQKWLQNIYQIDGALCCSRILAEKLYHWGEINDFKGMAPFKISWFNPGGTEWPQMCENGLTYRWAAVIKQMKQRPTFLISSTLEQPDWKDRTLPAFQQLWAEGMKINLVVVDLESDACEGWVQRLFGRFNSNEHFFWLKKPAEEVLAEVYRASSCLLINSDNAALTLSLAEAGYNRLPLMVRDLPVFREVAGAGAFYFQGRESTDLVSALKDWIILYEQGQHPTVDQVPWRTWRQAADQIRKTLAENAWPMMLPAR